MTLQIVKEAVTPKAEARAQEENGSQISGKGKALVHERIELLKGVVKVYSDPDLRESGRLDKLRSFLAAIDECEFGVEVSKKIKNAGDRDGSLYAALGKASKQTDIRQPVIDVESEILLVAKDTFELLGVENEKLRKGLEMLEGLSSASAKSGQHHATMRVPNYGPGNYIYDGKKAVNTIIDRLDVETAKEEVVSWLTVINLAVLAGSVGRDLSSGKKMSDIRMSVKEEIGRYSNPDNMYVKTSESNLTGTTSLIGPDIKSAQRRTASRKTSTINTAILTGEASKTWVDHALEYVGSFEYTRQLLASNEELRKIVTDAADTEDKKTMSLQNAMILWKAVMKEWSRLNNFPADKVNTVASIQDALVVSREALAFHGKRLTKETHSVITALNGTYEELKKKLVDPYDGGVLHGKTPKNHFLNNGDDWEKLYKIYYDHSKLTHAQRDRTSDGEAPPEAPVGNT